MSVFYLTKLITIGDQGLYEILEEELIDGSTFDEAYNSIQIRDKVIMENCIITVQCVKYQLTKTNFHFFEYDLTVERPNKFWIKVEGVIDVKERVRYMENLMIFHII